MLSPKYKELFENLINKTNEGKVKWQRTSQLGRFILNLGGQQISVYSSVDEDPDFWEMPGSSRKAEFMIKDKNGRDIDSLKTFNVGDAVYNDIQPLYVAAKSSANDIDKTIESLISSLSDL